MTVPAIKFFRKGSGERVAYAAYGSGPPLVCSAWWVSHVEEDWQDEAFRSFFEELGRHRTVIRYDRVGTGLSDRTREDVSLEGEVATLSELVDHLELKNFDVFGLSCGGPPALSYAATNGERVRRLVLFNSYLRGNDVGDRQVKVALQGLVRAHWGMGARALTNLFAPDLPSDIAAKLIQHQKNAASPEMAAKLLTLTFDVDVEAEAAQLDLPTLVVHRRSDHTIPYSAGRELAAALPKGELCTLEGAEHVPWFGDSAVAAARVLGFLGVTDAASPSMPVGNRFHRQGDIWTLAFDGHSAHVKHARGVADIAMLLQNPGQEISVSVLWSGAESARAVGGSDPVLDDEALASYRRRYEELKSELHDAEEAGDSARRDALCEERDALGRELRAAVGVGGRKRGLGDVSERARKAVSARIRASLKKISEVHPGLGAHLKESLRLGNLCAYSTSEDAGWIVVEDEGAPLGPI